MSTDPFFDTITEWRDDAAEAVPNPPPPPDIPTPRKATPPWEWGSRRGAPDPFLTDGKTDTPPDTAKETPPDPKETTPEETERPPDQEPPDLRKDPESPKETPTETVPVERAPETDSGPSDEPDGNTDGPDGNDDDGDEPDGKDDGNPGGNGGNTAGNPPAAPAAPPSGWRQKVKAARTAQKTATAKIKVPGVPRPALKRFVWAAAVGWTVGPGTVLASYDRLVVAAGVQSMPGYASAATSPHHWDLLSGPGRALRDTVWGLWDSGQHGAAGAVSLAAVAFGLVCLGAIRFVPAALVVFGSMLGVHIVVSGIPAGWDVVYISVTGACLVYGLAVTAREGISLSKSQGFLGFLRMIPLACAVTAILLPGTR